MGDGIARHFGVHAPPRLPNLDPAECRSRGENLLGPSLGNAIVAALDYFHPRDMTVRIQQIASVGVHHGVGPPLSRTIMSFQVVIDAVYGVFDVASSPLPGG
jgi:hypothetical protein